MSWPGEKQRHMMSSKGVKTTEQRETNSRVVVPIRKLVSPYKSQGLSKRPELNMLYELLKEHVHPIDGRSSHISYTANVETLNKIYDILTREFGEPTLNHPMINDLEWMTPDGYKIHVMKADSLNGKYTAHRIEIWKHLEYGPGGQVL